MNNDPIYIDNAGLVILSPFLKQLFDGLKFIENDAFIDSSYQSMTPRYLHYLISETTDVSESELVLNKLLCGLSPTAIISETIEISKEQKELLDGLLQAVINHWTTIKNTSAQGLQQTFLQREGILVEGADAWKLTVERKAYDILLDQVPFSFHTIYLPWMPKPIHVEW